MTTKDYCKIVMMLLLFFCAQGICTIVAAIYNVMNSGLMEQVANGDMTGQELAMILQKPQMICSICSLGLLLSDIVVIAVMLLTGWARHDNRRPDWQGCLWGMLVVVPLILAGNILGELADIADTMEDFWTYMFQSPYGILSIAILGPITEELVFRAGIQGVMMKRMGDTPFGVCMAIVLQGTVFGIVHWNPAQSYFAILFGMVLGFVYYRTGSIVPGILMHVFNNSLSIVISIACERFGVSDSFLHYLGGRTAGIYVCVCSIAALYLLLTKFSYKGNE